MKKITTLAIALIAMMPAIPSAFAQSSNHIFHVNTQYMKEGLDSAARAERNAMLKEYFEKVDMKNEYVLHCWTMTHFFSEDSREFVTIYEYKSWGDMEKANTRDEELAKQAWPDAVQRTAMMKKFNNYFSHHKDAIYSQLPNMTK